MVIGMALLRNEAIERVVAMLGLALPDAKEQTVAKSAISQARKRLGAARAIAYQRKGFRPSTLLTSLLDAARYPADELVALYHERWEIELGYDELKTHLLDRQEAIRSRTPEGVRQEIWGIALAYNLVRVERERAADEAGVPPNRISFVNALALIRNAWVSWSTFPLAPGRIPEAFLDLRRYLKLLILPPRRPNVSIPAP
jgi:hypothetical protein